jgi:hypothetical protein
MGNRHKTSNTLRALERELEKRLPTGWRIWLEALDRKRASRRAVDAVLKIQGPSGKTGLLLVEAKSQLEPRDVDSLAADLRTEGQPLLVTSPYLSPRTQERLNAIGIGYADLSGNVRFSLSQPGLFVQTQGATENPFSTRRERKSLRGPKAGRLVRALCDYRPPIGLRELAKRAGIDAGYTSRLIGFLDREALVVRDSRGAITGTEWKGLIRRWAQAYSPLEKSRVRWYLAPRGMTPLLERMKTISSRYAISGSWAAAQYAPVSATRLILCYSDDTEELARVLDVRPTESGANVALAVPFDSVVYERTATRDGVNVTAPSQIAVDLLGTPGRGPNEADALMDWMQENEDVWRH